MRTPILSLIACFVVSLTSQAQPDGKKDPTGTAVDGLQLSLKAEPAETTLNADGKDAKAVTLKLTFTNVSDKPIKFNAYDYRFARIRGNVKATPADSVQVLRLAVDRIRVDPKAEDCPEIKPGQSWSFAKPLTYPGSIPAGSDTFAVHSVQKPAKIRVSFAYNSGKLDTDLANGIWTGNLVSNEVTITVNAAAK